MPSSTISETTPVAPKRSKGSDGFTSSIEGLFTGLAKNSRAMVVCVIVLAVIAGGIALYLTRQQARSEEGRNALFLAQKSVQDGLKAIAVAEAPPAPATAKVTAGEVKDAKGAKPDPKNDPKKKPEADLEAVAFKKLDVDAKVADGVAKLKHVAEEYQGTRAGYEASVQLGNLYYDHGDPAKSAEWFSKASDAAPGQFERALALSSLGYAQENAGKSADAAQTYERALNLGEGSIKGDVLLGMARSYEALHDSAKAKSTYDKITSELPNTEYSRTAELRKARLE
jgi:tetratricopeptide (TPR) repeat protein